MKNIISRKQKIAIACIAVLVLAVWAILFYRINAEYPARKDHFIEQGKTETVNDVGITAQKAWFLTSGELMSHYDIPEKQIKDMNLGNCLTLMVQVKFTNRSSKTQQTEFIHLVAQSGACAQGIDLFLLRQANKDLDNYDHVTLKSGEEKTITLPYSFYPAQFPASEWSKIRTRQYEILATLYPVTQRFQLSPS